MHARMRWIDSHVLILQLVYYFLIIRLHVNSIKLIISFCWKRQGQPPAKRANLIKGPHVITYKSHKSINYKAKIIN